MKRTTLILILCAVALIMGMNWDAMLRAAVRAPAASPVPGTPLVEIPLNLNCTVTVDSRSNEKPVTAGTANKVTGFVAPDTAEGILIRLDSEWLVLRDGCYAENWIPTKKVIMIHVTR